MNNNKEEYDDDGKIYELEYNGNYYIGNTRKSVRTRYKEHKQSYIKYIENTDNYSNVCSSKKLFEMSENNEVNYRVIRYFDNISNKDLIERERDTIISYKEKYGDNCVNIALTTKRKTDAYTLKKPKDLNQEPFDRAKNHKKWRENNKDKIKLSKQKYKDSGKRKKDDIKYYEKHKETITERNKKWREDNKELIEELKQTKKEWNLSFKVNATEWGMCNNLLHIKL
jgi:hypothetical protein